MRAGGAARRSLASTLALLVSLGTLPAVLHAADDAAEPVATVGDVVLAPADLERAERRLAFFGALDGVPVDRRKAMALRRLLEETLLAAEAERRGIEVGDAAIDDRVAALVQDLSARNLSLDRMLVATGLDRETLRGQLRLEIAVQRLLAELVTPDEIGKVYEAHHREFDGTRYRVAHIVLRPDGAGNESAVLAEARRIRVAIVSGEISFAAAAARHSAAPSRHKGGDIGFIPRHGQLAEEFARAAFALEKGAVSEPVLSPFGVHLITVTDIDDGTEGPERIRPQLERIAAETVLRRLLEECRERTPVILAPGTDIEPALDAPTDRR